MTSRKTDRVIAHFLDGTLLRGSTPDFYPSRAGFRLTTSDGTIHRIDIRELKALFFVKKLDGAEDYRERKGFFDDGATGNKVLVEFFDGEVIFGHSIAYSPKGFGFFLTPGDPDCNNVKVFVVHSATKRVKVKPSSSPRRKSARKKKTRVKSRRHIQ